MRSLALASAIALPATMVAAHPHVFVDTKLRVVVGDDGVFQGVEVQWTYDDFYSLLLLTDYGLDNDGDGRLTENELRRLDGFDLQWIAGFEGDSYALRNGKTVKLGKPQGRGTSVEAGRITTVHFRPAKATADGLVLKAYDPTFYTAYDLIGPVAVEGPCNAAIQPADLDAAYTLVEELLYATPSAEVEDAYPEVGEAFADTVTLSCSG
ncbi:DUF1007 family protein [Maritimibacter sp. DP1N21-5]|uniref:DUF1007 family protein n=2 Tax=Roseobacteraceae TaxID=2854170 RepID=UPI001C43A6C4|nr:DUF1007 family protein [Tateyamaria omphalii]MBV7408904.1 DUF1007 family protein [Maritimibacter sp. DP1N21-5]MBY5934409.1 DUF1007 family protein [Tateyamaria omphalii]